MTACLTACLTALARSLLPSACCLPCYPIPSAATLLSASALLRSSLHSSTPLPLPLRYNRTSFVHRLLSPAFLSYIHTHLSSASASSFSSILFPSTWLKSNSFVHLVEGSQLTHFFYAISALPRVLRLLVKYHFKTTQIFQFFGQNLPVSAFAWAIVACFIENCQKSFI